MQRASLVSSDNCRANSENFRANVGNCRANVRNCRASRKLSFYLLAVHGGSQLTIVGQSRIIRIIAQQLSFLFRYIDGVFGRVRNPINQANYVILGGTKIEVKFGKIFL